MKIVVKLRANRGKIARFDKIRDYWTEVHQMWKLCSLIIAIEPFESGFTMGQSIVECHQSKE